PRLNAPDGAGAVSRSLHLAVGAEHELRGLDDAAALLPPGADTIGIFARHAVAERIGKLRSDFLRLVERIDAGSDDLRADAIQFGFSFLEGGQLPPAVGSPVAAVEEDHLPLR